MSAGPTVAEASLAAPESRGADGLQDEELLTRFFRQRDDGAFAAIVQRHGPLVYGVCRRILGDATEADDAFQATFLVLVRKGAALRQPGRLANWLYGVACRTARKARAKAAFRRETERQAGEMPSTSEVGEMTLDELKSVLDEEISRLPEKYAMPLVLCYLEGKTNAEAAAQLGWPEGSISRRLSRARELLKSRLAKRGLALSAALIASVFSRPSVASVPVQLISSTTNAGSLVSQGALVEDVVSPATAKLVHEVVLGMSAASRFTVPTMFAVVALVLFMTAAIWELTSPAHAAGMSRFYRAGNAAHALLRTAVGGGNSVSVVAGNGSAVGASSGSAAPGCAPAACGSAAP
jgi:RNA polymerase sigma factor (sigma-70 family)